MVIYSTVNAMLRCAVSTMEEMGVQSAVEGQYSPTVTGSQPAVTLCLTVFVVLDLGDPRGQHRHNRRQQNPLATKEEVQ